MAALLLGSSPVYAAIPTDQGMPPGKSVVFLLDASNSMNTNDKNRLAIDSIAQLIYSLPSDYSTGVVAYNKDIVCATPMVDSTARDTIIKSAEGVTYTGYTNAGAGLEQAVALLDSVAAEEKTIVILSDGEILMNGDAATAESNARFQSAVEKAAEQGTEIHVIGLGDEMTDKENTIFSAATATDGNKYHAPKAADIQQAIDSILVNELHVKKSTSSIINATGEVESLTVMIPFQHASKIRILLTCVDPIQNLSADFNASSGIKVSGTHYSLIEMDRPTVDQVVVRLQGQKGSQIKVELIPEYEVSANVNVAYEDTLPTDEAATHFKRMATTDIRFYDAGNPNVQVFADSFFDKAQIGLQVGSDTLPTAIVDGKLSYQSEVTKDESQPIAFDFSQLSVNVLYSGEVSATVIGPDPLPPPPDYRPYIIIGIVLLAAIIVLIILLLHRRKKRKPLPMPEPAPPPPSKFSYVGKLNLYIARSPSGYDIPPLSFNLFRLPSSKVISLQEVLNECNIDEIFEGASKIFFKTGANRTLVITNSSDCTIMRNREVMLKNRSYELPIDSKVDITFEDERSELALQYKDVKPSALPV